MTPKMSQEAFIEKVRAINQNIEILSEYNGIRAPVLRRCKICGDTRYSTPRSIFENRGCVVCVAREKAAKKRKSHDQFVSEVYAINPNIAILSEYKTVDTPILCECKIDGFRWTTRASSLRDRHGCPECGRKKNEIASKHRMTHDEFVGVIRDRFPKLEIMSEFKNTSTKVHYRCSECGYEWKAVPNTLLHNKNAKGCPQCSGKAHVSLERFLSRLSEANPYISYVSGYKNVSTNAIFSCKKCGSTWSTTPVSALKGKGCQHCKSSHGEQRIAEYLTKNNIKYIPQYKFKNCVDVRPLPFDFYLTDCNTVIEYDGEQHFEPVRFGNYTWDEAIEQFEGTKRRDKIKTNYCHENNITLIRIPYTELDEITNILDKQIS